MQRLFLAGMAIVFCGGLATAGDWTIVSVDPGVTAYQYVSEDFLVRNPPWTTDGVRDEWLQHATTIEHRENGVLAAMLDGSTVQSAVLLGDQWADNLNAPGTPWLVNYDVHFIGADPNDLSNLHARLEFQAAGITHLTLVLNGSFTGTHLQFVHSPTHSWTDTPETSQSWRIKVTLSRSAPVGAMIWLDNITITEGATSHDNETFSLTYGDLNCDGLVSFADINPFVLALADSAGYAAAFPGCDILSGDMNLDGLVNFDDINPFVAALTGG